uniref:Uncharacterized protein n=1 Tax=Lotharella globosa TaxID=91324 RepID=A0A7S4DPA5_9EUKA
MFSFMNCLPVSQKSSVVVCFFKKNPYTQTRARKHHITPTSSHTNRYTHTHTHVVPSTEELQQLLNENGIPSPPEKSPQTSESKKHDGEMLKALEEMGLESEDNLPSFESKGNGSRRGSLSRRGSEVKKSMMAKGASARTRRGSRVKNEIEDASRKTARLVMDTFMARLLRLCPTRAHFETVLKFIMKQLQFGDISWRYANLLMLQALLHNSTHRIVPKQFESIAELMVRHYYAVNAEIKQLAEDISASIVRKNTHRFPKPVFNFLRPRVRPEESWHNAEKFLMTTGSGKFLLLEQKMMLAKMEECVLPILTRIKCQVTAKEETNGDHLIDEDGDHLLDEKRFDERPDSAAEDSDREEAARRIQHMYREHSSRKERNNKSFAARGPGAFACEPVPTPSSSRQLTLYADRPSESKTEDYEDYGNAAAAAAVGAVGAAAVAATTPIAASTPTPSPNNARKLTEDDLYMKANSDVLRAKRKALRDHESGGGVGEELNGRVDEEDQNEKKIEGGKRSDEWNEGGRYDATNDEDEDWGFGGVSDMSVMSPQHIFICMSLYFAPSHQCLWLLFCPAVLASRVAPNDGQARRY